MKAFEKFKKVVNSCMPGEMIAVYNTEWESEGVFALNVLWTTNEKGEWDGRIGFSQYSNCLKEKDFFEKPKSTEQFLKDIERVCYDPKDPIFTDDWAYDIVTQEEVEERLSKAEEWEKGFQESKLMKELLPKIKKAQIGDSIEVNIIRDEKSQDKTDYRGVYIFSGKGIWKEFRGYRNRVAGELDWNWHLPAPESHERLIQDMENWMRESYENEKSKKYKGNKTVEFKSKEFSREFWTQYKKELADGTSTTYNIEKIEFEDGTGRYHSQWDTPEINNMGITPEAKQALEDIHKEVQDIMKSGEYSRFHRYSGELGSKLLEKLNKFGGRFGFAREIYRLDNILGLN
jgi:hypothetical protein